MDILTHTLSGIAVGTVAASFVQMKGKPTMFILFISGLGGALPDIDAISMWSKFDSTIGAFFKLPHTGRVIYGEKFWYSHHAFMHSILAPLIIASIAILLSYLLRYKTIIIRTKDIIQYVKSKSIYFLSFVLAFTMHLLEDMPTPASVWGGVNFFWPSSSYIGGLGKIWWWNNYDIFLIVVVIITLNLLFSLVGKFLKRNTKYITTSVFVCGFLLSMYQINTRGYDFAYTGNTSKYNTFEEQSKHIQKQILGEKLFNLMVKFDNKLAFYF